MANNREVLQSYLARISNSLDTENGAQLASLVKVNDAHAKTLQLVVRSMKVQALESAVRNRLDETWAEVVCGHLKVLKEMANATGSNGFGSESGSSVDIPEVLAAELQNSTAQSFHQFFPSQTRWCLPVLYALNGDLWSLSAQADDASRKRGSKGGRLEEAARTMNKAFSYCVTDRFSPLERSRKWGTYHIVNLLFKTYFKLTQTNLCSTILRSVAAGDLPGLERYPIADQVTFKFYVGVLSFYNEQYKKAEEELSFALWHSPTGKGKQARKRNEKIRILILNYLIPTRFILGFLPSASLFIKYPALDYLYGNFALAIRRGDVRLFDETLYRLQRDLINRGTYLTVERARALAARMLFKKVWLINKRSTRIPMAQFQRALHLAGTDVTPDAVACMLANMIDKGYLKGYLSFEKQMVVTAKEDPFPNLKMVPV
ncbi:hypothetical protein SpCBS45565_g03237 [Spizellomyces sp. 'palustris']|nr:hypothetical protein SpCBS45565_g03237 [Spizellomyces sp. 'palustris']